MRPRALVDLKGGACDHRVITDVLFDRAYTAVAVGVFKWARIDGEYVESCLICGVPSRRVWPALVDWRDVESVRAQRLSVDGDPCPECAHLRPLPFPVMQLRPGDGPGLVLALPADSPGERDKEVLAEVLKAAAEFDRSGAQACCTVRMDWWGRVYNRPLGPVLAGVRASDLPVAEEEAEHWRKDTVAAMSMPDVRGAVVDLLGAPDEPAIAEVLGARPELLDVRWRLTVDLLLSEAAGSDDEYAGEAVAQRRSRLRYAELAGPGAPLLAEALDADPRDEQALATIAADPALPAGLRVASLLTRTQALRDRPDRADDTTLLATAQAAVTAADEFLGPTHDMVIAARMNLAVILQERQGEQGAVEALAVLEEIAPVAAACCSRQLPDLAMNVATVAAQIPGTRSDQQEDAAALLVEAQHLRMLLQSDPHTEAIALLADRAAVARGRVSGNRRENLQHAVALLRQATQDPASRSLPEPERVLLASNLANALYDLHARAPDLAQPADAATGARDAAAQARAMAGNHPVAIQTLSNAGAALAGLYSQSPPGERQATLRMEAVDLLTDAVTRARAAFAAGHPETLRAMLNLAAAHGAAGAGAPDELAEANALLEAVADQGAARPDLMFAARSNLGQLALGQGRHADAADEFGQAAAARRAAISQARTPITKLGEVIRTADAAGRHALAAALAGRQNEAIDALEANRATLLSDGAPPSRTPPPSPGVVTVHAATCTFGTVVVVRGSGGEPVASVDALNEARLRPLVSALLTAPDITSRQTAFDALAATLATAVTDPVDAIISLMDEPPRVVEVVACGVLASCPLHCLPGADGRAWIDRCTVRARVSARSAAAPWAPLGLRAAGVFDPDHDLPYAKAERAALQRWTGPVSEPGPMADRRAWLRNEASTANILHFACHAALDQEDPMRSWFSLGDQARITVDVLREVGARQLALAVAPACQSGAASPDAPDELLGVGHALLHAGAQTVIAASWDADDAATALTIAGTYELLRTGTAPADALAAAQRQVAAFTAAQLSEFVIARLAGVPDAEWLPYDLAIELDALLATPDMAAESQPFGHPVLWGALTVLEA